jgi:hypothetical protein
MTMSGVKACVRCGGALALDGGCSVCGAVNVGSGQASDHDLSPDAHLSAAAVPNAFGVNPSQPAGMDPQTDSANFARRNADKQVRPAFLFNRDTSERFQLNHSVSKIGRDQTNNISITTDHYISRHHAWVLQMHGGYWLEDLGSTNGTLLNGELLSERKQMVAGDRITLGKTELVFAVE